MSDITKKASYLRGYADGLDISLKSDEGKLIGKMLELIEEMAEMIDELDYVQCETIDIIDDLEEDMALIVDDFYGEDDEEDEDEDWDEDDEDDDDWMDDDIDAPDGDLFEIRCPNCGEDVMVDFDMLDSSNAIVCPNCREEIELEFNFEDEE